MQYAGPSETAAIFASLPGSVEVPLGAEDALDPDTVAVPAEAAAGAAEVAMQGAVPVLLRSCSGPHAGFEHTGDVVSVGEAASFSTASGSICLRESLFSCKACQQSAAYRWLTCQHGGDLSARWGSVSTVGT